MATSNNSWNNQVPASNVTINGGTVSIGTDSTNNEINISSTETSGRTITIGNATGTSSVTMNCGTGGVQFPSSSVPFTTTFGSTSGSSTTTIQSGTGTLTVQASTGAITINSGTGTLSIGSDATNATYNVGTGAAIKTVTAGTTNSSSSLAMQCGTGKFVMASATGTTMSVTSTGPINYALQPAIGYFLGANVTNVTGNGEVFSLGTTTALTKSFDQDSNFSGTTFTAPVTGNYFLYMSPSITSATTETSFGSIVNTTQNSYALYLNRVAGAAQASKNILVFVLMDSGDTAKFQIVASGAASNSATAFGSGGSTHSTSIGGWLVC